ncbi:hypothetical protein GCM10018785_71510 [Streptomyces longispororuber]|uniref:Novel STAND NTPase 1 domain-containing protein n=1 Tax=Streptomyces longispororuber TaxID=68230 RepID=A0A919AAY6_9ACTN|nr:hypothetical protein [Streptomyces longispororuber]GHE96232.1 hypothetical protein GCM10018785_71510 [Streptomyces longispororuber]
MALQVEYSAAALSFAARGEQLPSLAVTLAYVTACGGDVEQWKHRWQQAQNDVGQSFMEPADASDAPYRGLARFEPSDCDRFFGRTRLTDELTEMARTHRITVVLGPSGSGKSSLLRAGLIPRLQATTDPALRPAAIRILTPGLRPAREHRERFVPAVGEGETWLVVDQFEEAFTMCQDEQERQVFIGLLMRAQEPGSRIRVVLGVRADFYARCLEHEDLAIVLAKASLPVGPMTPSELRETIIKPAAAAGLIVERQLTAHLIQEAGGQPGSLPLMSHALLETWRHRRGRTLTLETYEATGGLHSAISQTAETLYNQLTAPQKEVSRRLLLRLITPGAGAPDTRRTVPRSELGLPEPSGEAHHILERLSRARLITLTEDSVDLAHEALIAGWPRLQSWIEESRERLRCHRQLTEAARTWQELDQDPGALYRGTRLATTQEHFPQPHHHPELTSIERTFLTASITTREKEQQAELRNTRRLRRFAGAVSVLLVLALTAGVLAWQQSQTSNRARDRALEAQRIAQSRQLAARSDALLTSDPDLGSLLAIHAYRTAPTPEAASSLYSAAGLPLRHRITGYADEVSSVVFSPDGRTLATGGDEGTVRLWNTANGKAYASITAAAGMDGHVAFSPDSKTVASGDAASVVRLWDVASGEPRSALTGHTEGLEDLAFSPDGQVLATGGGDGKVILWNVAKGTDREVLVGHTGSVTGLVFSSDGRALATGDDEGKVLLWDVATGKRRAALAGHTDAIQKLAFSPDGNLLATGGADSTARLWDTGTRKRPTILTGHRDDVTSLVFSPDGRTLATGDADNTVRLWDAASGKARTNITERADKAAFNPDGRTMATGDLTGVVRLWDTASGKVRETIPGHTDMILDLAFSPDGQTLATGSADETVGLWDVTTRSKRTVLTGRPTDDTTAISPDAQTLASARDDGTVRLWDAASGKHRVSLAGHAGDVRAVVFSRKGRMLATADEDSVRLWDVASGEQRGALIGHTSGVRVVAFSPDGQTLATASRYGDESTVHLWDAASGQHRASLTGHTGEVHAVTFSPDGNTLATSADDETVRLWDTDHTQSKDTLTGLPGPVALLAFSPDGRTLATGAFDKTLRLWNTASGKQRASLTGHTGDVTAVAFSPDGRTVATTADDQSLRLWDTELGIPRTTYPIHSAEATAVAFHPDGRTLSVAGEGKTQHWRTDLPTLAQSVRKICNAIHRDLTRTERATYLPESPARPVCTT